MQEYSVSGMKYRVRSGTVEALGNEHTFGDGSIISMLRFTDGSYLRNVAVDGSVGPYVQPGQKLTVAYVKSSKNNLVLAIDAEGYGFRCTDPENMKKGNGTAVGVMLFFGVLSLLPLFPVMTSGLNPFSIAMMVLGIPFYLFTAAGVGKLMWSSRMETLIHALEKQRSVIPNQSQRAEPPMAGALSRA